ncbi:MAG: HAD-IA family hydrolase [Hyphomicrobiaceae bacterium]
MSAPAKLEALIFDVDGTLAETEELHRAAFNETFAAAGLDWHWDQRLYGVLLSTTGGKERMTRYVTECLGRTPAQLPPGHTIASLHAAKTAVFARLLTAGKIDLRLGVRQLLRQARSSGLRLAIATTTSRANVDALLRATLGAEANGIFDVIVAGDEAARKKPAPDVYLEALSRLRLAADACLAIEDSNNGLAAALSADLAVLMTASRYTAGETFTGALKVVASLDDLAPSRCDRDARSTPSGHELLAAIQSLHAARGHDADRHRRPAP